MKKYYLALKKDPFEILPLTFHICRSTEDPEWKRFKQYFEEVESLKPKI